MKQIFDWLREQIKGLSNAEADYYYANSNDVIDRENTLDIINEAEAKWEAEVCELLDELVLETPQYRHGVCAFRHEEECWEYESCEHCLVSAIKDLLVNPNSRFKKISEVE